MKVGWEIIREHRFDEELGNLKKSIQRGDDCIRGIEWVLSRDPDGQGLPYKDGIRCIGFCDDGEDPAIIAYTLSPTKREVYLLSIFADGTTVA